MPAHDRASRAALSQAAREELATRNVAALVRVSVPRTTSRKVWAVEDARRFLEASRDARDPYHVGYVLLLVLGLRRGEVLARACAMVSAGGVSLLTAAGLRRENRSSSS